MYKQSPGRMNMPKTGRGIPVNMVNPIMQKETKEEVSARNNQAASDKIVERAAEEKIKQKVKDALPESGEHARKRSLARGATRGTFFGLEKLFD